jgi:hypothetical protein
MRNFRCPLCGQTGIPGAHRCPTAPVAPAVAAPALGPPVAPPPAWKDRQRLNQYTSNMGIDGHLQSIPLDIRQKYYLANYNRGLYRTPAVDNWWNDNNGPGGTTIAQYRQMNRNQQLAVIDALWDHIMLLFPANTPRSHMLDPATSSSSRAFQSSVTISQAFSRFGYAYRCDTRDPASVTQYGFLRAYHFNPPADIQDTLVYRAVMGQGGPAKVGMWKKNRDAISEMTICVARNLKGCTKFPKAEHTGQCYVYAVKVPAGKQGFDTERWQMTLDSSNALWRPGEKAFLDLQPADILASIPVFKTAPSAADTGQGAIFRFRFTAAAWTNHTATPDEMRFLADQLAPVYNGGADQLVYRDEDFDDPRF